ncbi:nucleoside 2-deoxyribosyltransferase [Variovorax saccharolyticus]|uniref:nucleoside 2-deoxyribosyltransferase n=1 Tax=Variovorax saccharolyticus TaxID=3053516 RepID=UPI00257670AB|nr:nucleoside 2-deoxyribosyltransferase [Variovorax sp. J31P216]MDM0027081.1 nucleoside 2-deoxyribosyltransferase [Variovorax sp. J31P216]
MEKIFLAGPFKALVNKKTNAMSPIEIARFMTIIVHFENKGWTVHCAHRREKWGKEFMTPEECTSVDFSEIKKCDYFVAFPGSPASPGTHVELGWASALGKPIILLLEKNKEYAFLVQGLGEVSPVITIEYENSIDPSIVENAINTIKK